MASSKLKTLFPNTTTPLICNAPMFRTCNVNLATAVTKAGGLGFLSGGFDFSAGSAQIAALREELTTARQLLGFPPSSTEVLPVGIGVITFHSSVSDFPSTFIPVLRDFRPAALWLFAPNPATPGGHELIIDAVRSLSSEGVNVKIIVQTGSVAAAREAIQQGADVIVAQGIDAGGHQWAGGAGVVTIVPEISDLLDKEFPDRQIGLLAAGGIADGRGVAAALALGAGGVVMGTRFVASNESATPAVMKEAIISATDGGVSTAKSTVHDDINGIPWPSLYDGRAVIGKSYQDHLAGLPLEKNIEKLNEATAAGDASRRINWAGTVVGLIKSQEAAGSIVTSAREEAKRILNKLHFED